MEQFMMGNSREVKYVGEEEKLAQMDKLKISIGRQLVLPFF